MAPEERAKHIVHNIWPEAEEDIRMEAIELHRKLIQQCVVDQTAKYKAIVDKLPTIVKELCEHRELSDCWMADVSLDGPGDCGNWPSCNPHCPLKQLRDMVGIVPQEDGGIDKQPPPRSCRSREGSRAKMKSRKEIYQAITANTGRILREGEDGFQAQLASTNGDFCIIASWGGKWDHVSVHIMIDDLEMRTPTWDEMCFVKEIFWRHNEWVIQFHPGKSKYINVHPHVLHLWKSQTKAIPHPPINFV